MGELIDRAAAERVVRRAVEIDHEALPAGDGALDPEALVSAAREIGISEAAVRAALTIERLGEPPAPGRLDRAAGPAEIACEIAIDVPADIALDRLDRWLVTGHHLRREHLTDVSGEWSKRDDAVATVQRSIRSLGGGAELATVRSIQATAASLDGDQSMLRVTVSHRARRRVAIGTATGVGTASTASAVVLGAAVPPLGLVVVPGLAVAGATLAISKRTAARTERQLRRLLHQIASDDRPGTIGSGITRRLANRR